MAQNRPLSKAEIKAAIAREFSNPMLPGKVRDKKAAEQLRDLTPDKAAKAHRDSQQ
jgi:hypothetical protein